MPKRNRWDDDGGRGPRDSCRRCPPQHHLCVVLDHWSRGYSIYKLDVDGDPDDADLDLRPHRLPDAPLFRLETPPDESGRFARFAAVGSRVFAMSYLEQNRDAPVLAHDTATGALAVGPCTPFELQSSPHLVAAGGSLYAFDGGRGGDVQSFKALLRHGRRGWVWSSLRAAHPDGRTVFFSARGSGTFSFDAETEAWTRHGAWTLPFRGQAFYDAEVEAWVGLHDMEEGRRVCSCDVVAAPGNDGNSGGSRPPAWKLVEERMTHEDERSMGAELAHMGDGRFCLVEYLKRRGVPEDRFDEHCRIFVPPSVRQERRAVTRSARNRTPSSFERLEPDE